MNSIHFVDSQSSFSSSALVLNTKLKTLYTTPQMHKYRKDYKDVNVIYYNFEELNNFLLLENDIFL